MPGSTAGKRKCHLIYNDNGGGISQGYLGRPVEALHDWVDRVLNHVQVDSFSLSVATPDITFYPSDVGETLGQRFASTDDIPDAHLREIATTIRALAALGTDSIAVMAERVHQRGTEFIAEMWMGDTHHASTDLSFAMAPQYLVDHPQWVIRRSDQLAEGVHETAMDPYFWCPAGLTSLSNHANPSSAKPPRGLSCTRSDMDGVSPMDRRVLATEQPDGT